MGDATSRCVYSLWICVYENEIRSGACVDYSFDTIDCCKLGKPHCGERLFLSSDNHIQYFTLALQIPLSAVCPLTGESPGRNCGTIQSIVLLPRYTTVPNACPNVLKRNTCTPLIYGNISSSFSVQKLVLIFHLRHA